MTSKVIGSSNQQWIEEHNFVIYHQKGSSVNFSSAVENVVIKSVDMHDTINLIDIVSVHREQ